MDPKTPAPYNQCLGCIHLSEPGLSELGGQVPSFAAGSRVTKRVLVFANRVYIPKNVLRITAR